MNEKIQMYEAPMTDVIVVNRPTRWKLSKNYEKIKTPLTFS